MTSTDMKISMPAGINARLVLQAQMQLQLDAHTGNTNSTRPCIVEIALRRAAPHVCYVWQDWT